MPEIPLPELPFKLPALPEMVPFEHAEILSLSEVTGETPMLSTPAIPKSAGNQPEGESWYDLMIEPPLKNSVKLLNDRGLNTFTSSANNSNIGQLDQNPAHIGIKVDDGEASRHLLNRVAALQKEVAESGFKAEDFGFSVENNIDPKSPEWNGVYINVQVGPNDTVDEVSAKFELLVNYLINKDSQIEASNSNPESEKPGLNMLDEFNKLQSPDFRKAKVQKLREELEDSEMTHVSKLLDRISILNIEAKTGDAIKIDNQIKKIQNTMNRLFGYKKVERCKDVKEMIRYEENEDRNYLNDSEAVEVSAQFLDSKNLLHAKKPGDVFISGENLVAVGKSITAETVWMDGHFELPLDSFVSSENFIDWGGTNEQSSRKKVEDYASRSTPIPPINDIYCYVLPNGKSVLKSANAHRVAAAIKRGDRTIKFKGNLTIRELTYMPEVLESMA